MIGRGLGVTGQGVMGSCNHSYVTKTGLGEMLIFCPSQKHVWLGILINGLKVCKDGIFVELHQFRINQRNAHLEIWSKRLQSNKFRTCLNFSRSIEWVLVSSTGPPFSHNLWPKVYFVQTRSYNFKLWYFLNVINCRNK